MEPEKKSNGGAFIGLVVIIIILVIGGIYIWMSNEKASNGIPSLPVTDQDSAALDSLEQDLNTTDTDLGVDASILN